MTMVDVAYDSDFTLLSYHCHSLHLHDFLNDDDNDNDNDDGLLIMHEESTGMLKKRCVVNNFMRLKVKNHFVASLLLLPFLLFREE